MKPVPPCPSCGQPLAANALVCQHCGHRKTTFLTKLMLAVIGLIVAGFVLGAVFGV